MTDGEREGVREGEGGGVCRGELTGVVVRGVREESGATALVFS
jgi:hypothetical protein